MQFNGKWVTIGMVVVAIAAASFAWWFQFNRGWRSLEYWQGEQAAVIRHGEKAELLELSLAANDSSAEADSLQIGGKTYHIVQRATLDKAPGFVHARHALIDDASYLWNEPPPAQIAWTHALEFENEAGRSVTVLLALPPGLLRPIDGERVLTMDEILRTGLTQFFAEHLADSDRPQ